MKRRLLALLILVTLLSGLAVAQPAPTATPSPASEAAITVTASVDKQVLEIGQSLRVQVEIGYSDSVELKPVDPKNWDIKPFELQDSALARLPDDPGHLKVRYNLRVTAFDEGEVQFPAITLEYGKAGESHKASSKPIAIKVNRVTPGKDDKPDEIRDLKQMNGAPFPPLLLAALIALVALLGWALYKFIGWLRRPRPKQAEPALPPFEWARRELDRIEREKIWEEGRYEEYYDQLTLVLRHYLGWRLGVALLEKTTSETLTALKDKTGLEYDAWKELKVILEEGDLTKFARQRPSPENILTHLGQARRLLEAHAPQPPKEEKKGEAA